MPGGITIETITVTRPMKVIAFVCTFITTFLMIGACSTSDWVVSEGWHEGLFVQCADKGALTPLPFDAENILGCQKAHNVGYLRGVAALVIIVVFTDFFGTLLTGLGLRSTDPNKKYKYYRVAIYSLILSVLALFLALIIYPVSFTKDISTVSFEKTLGDLDFDNDGILDHLDNDDDNDGIVDALDTDDDNDGILDALDNDDDNDGIPDSRDGNNNDFDGDGIPNDLDNDDDGDGSPDSEDKDSDNDGIPDVLDKDDDNDNIPDVYEEDSDGDGEPDAIDADDNNNGVPDEEEASDSDGDGEPDTLDKDDDNDGIPDEQEERDTDGDGVPDSKDGDDDNDGVVDDLDNDDDNDGIPDDEDTSGDDRRWHFGFAYGASWASAILISLSLVLLICDRESEEIFYKERVGDEDEDPEEEV